MKRHRTLPPAVPVQHSPVTGSTRCVEDVPGGYRRMEVAPTRDFDGTAALSRGMLKHRSSATLRCRGPA
jgi:hypothetical protein